jgi:tRNA G18 (ribose-2'-O)-methylase SpoU
LKSQISNFKFHPCHPIIAAPMPLHPIHSLDDPRLAPYRYMKEKELARDGRRFIAEGENVVRRLLASSTPVESVFLAERKVPAIAQLCPDSVPVFAATDDLIEQIIGFEFHSGVLACGIRPPNPALETIIPPPPAPALLTICQQITNAENLGSLIRISAAFGANAIILGERCCDPYFRQCVRVSMGSIFAIPIVRSTNLLSDLDAVKSHGITRLAAVVGQEAEPLDSIEPISRVAVIFGSEAQGLDPATINRCDRRVTIPMRLGTDSLNVGVAAAVFLYQLTRG